MRCFPLLGMILALLLSACGSGAPSAATAQPAVTTLNVFAAASLTGAFEEIGKNFEAAHPGVSVKFNFGGSQTLRTQIEQGAKADVFASANAKEMEALVTGDLVSAENVKVFLTNQLVVILPASNPAKLTNLEDLARAGIKVILAAKEVPVGNYSLQVLDQLDKAFGNGYKDQVLKNVVSYENDVKQVVAKIQLGEADAGIVYSSDRVAAPELQKIDIPPEDNVIARYPIAALKNSSSAQTAQAFIDYVFSPEGQAVLQKWGFQPIP